MSDPQSLISVRDVTKSFAGAGDQPIPVLEGIDLEVADSEFVALLGRSGSGKSTLLRCMAGLIAPTSGEVFYRGTRLVGCNRGTAMVFQTFALLPWLSVQQNVEIGLEARGVPVHERAEQALRAIDLVGLDGYESAFPKELSGGMRQRVGFARALVLEPDVLLMDEPFSALDVLTAENLRGELLELWEGHRFPTRSVVMVTHNIEEAVLLADRILVLGTNPGRLRAELVNEVPRPRHRRTPDFDALVDHIYGLMTGASVPATVTKNGAGAGPGTPGDTPLPLATVDGLSGLAEILEHQDGSSDLADLARLLGLEVDDMLPLVDALVLLGLATLEEDFLKLTANGRDFASATIQESKRIFATQVLERAPLVRTIDRALRGSQDGNLASGFFTDLLHRNFGEAEARQQLNTAINWGRYAELYAYDGGRDLLLLEEHEGHVDGGEPAPEVPVRRGALRLYLGAYPGSGKTYAMLRDAHRRLAAGEDVVVAVVDARGRSHTQEAVGDLEHVPLRMVGADGTEREEMDLDAVLERHPGVALVDDLAHANSPGCAHAWRWQDVDAMLDAGIEVMATLDASQLESQRASVEHIIGEPLEVTVPDRVLDRAADVQFVDIAPTALRRRVAHGNVCPHDEVESALSGPFRLEALGPLRELALRLVARRVGGGDAPTRLEPQDVVVAAAPSLHVESLVRRGARLARRTGGRCTVLTVERARAGPGSRQHAALIRATAEQLGATFTERRGGNVEREIRETVREVVAQHLLVGASDPRQHLRVRRSSITDRLIEALPDVDVHVIAWLPPGAAADLSAATEEEEARFGRRGTLRVYLGYAHGCGTTTAMLDEAHRRASRGTDCVVAAITRNHPGIDAVLADLEIVEGESGTPLERPDFAAMLARNPQVVCIDDLAAAARSDPTLVEDLERLLEVGMTVIGTLHVADQLEGSVMELIDDIELVDLPSSELRERVRAYRGDTLSSEADLADEYSEENLARLREQAFRVVAWHADEQQVRVLRRQGAGAHWEARPRVMVCVAPRPGMERLIRRAAGLAASLDTDFRAVTVRTDEDSDDGVMLLGRYAELTRQLGGQVVSLDGPAVAPALARYARDNLVTEILAMRGSQGGARAGATLRELTRT
ncbi:MAG TPA: AAA-associated domain-containing protein, partial [Acidimicrobiales bacterium]|nr:AAA-associated domain-containing protein [Acidimicrobiales bacterium]